MTDPDRGLEVDEATAILIRARGFIERGWCKRADAFTADGQYAQATDSHAVVWSAYGALVAAGLPKYKANKPLHPAYVRLDTAMGKEGVGAFNDRQETVTPVLTAFDRAIAAGVTNRPTGLMKHHLQKGAHMAGGKRLFRDPTEKTRKLTVAVPVETDEQLRRVAARSGTNVGALIRGWIEKALKETVW